MASATHPEYAYSGELPSILDEWGDRVRSGIWPNSVSLWMAALWVALFLVRPWEKILPELGEIHFARIYALSMIAIVVLSGRFRMVWSYQTFAVITFVGALFASYYTAYDQDHAWRELYKYLTLVGFYFILLSVIRTPYQLAFIATCFLAATAFYLVLAEYDFFFNGAYRYRMGVKRLIGVDITFSGPNEVAGSTVLSLPIAWFLWRTRETFTQTWPPFMRRVFPIALLLYPFLALSAIVLTNSRGGVLGCLVFLGLVAISGRGVSRKVILSLLLIASVWTIMPDEHKNRVRTIWDAEAGPKNAARSAEGRIEGLMAGIAMFHHHPVTGVGLGCFAAYRSLFIDGEILNAHNLVGQILGETGILGAGTFCLLVLGIILNCCYTLKQTSPSGDASSHLLRELAKACLISILLLLYFGLLSHNLLRFNWLWIAAFALLARRFSCDLEATED